MEQAVSERTIERKAERPAGEYHGGRLLFGAGLDPRECGSRGGKASQLSRKLSKQRALEAQIEASRSGYAKLALLRIRQERERELEHERRRMDEQVRRADATLERLTDWREQEEQRLAELRTQCDELRQRIATDEGLDEWLREVGPERVEASGERLGWFAGEVDDASSVQS